MRERVQRRTSVERPEAERGRERTPTTAALVLDVQRSAGNTATARLLQRAPHHRKYAPAAKDAIAPEFKKNHVGQDEREAIDQHATRGTYATNTFVAITGDDAAEEIDRYLSALADSEDISNWDGFEFVTRSGYWCYETTLLDNTTGLYQVRKVFATIRVRAWWNDKLGVFRIGHMFGLAVRDKGSESTATIQMTA